MCAGLHMSCERVLAEREVHVNVWSAWSVCMRVHVRLCECVRLLPPRDSVSAYKNRMLSCLLTCPRTWMPCRRQHIPSPLTARHRACSAHFVCLDFIKGVFLKEFVWCLTSASIAWAHAELQQHL
jgi:hypothetical protein